MPIYQYKCQDCEHQLEALQKMSDPLLVDCPSCGHPALRKQLTAAAFKLKGTGWYETDFKNSGKQAPAKNGKDSQQKNTSATGSETTKTVKDTADKATAASSGTKTTTVAE
jgi:putative FmdB family regulatory protein